MRLIASLPALYVFSLVVDSPKRTRRVFSSQQDWKRSLAGPPPRSLGPRKLGALIVLKFMRLSPRWLLRVRYNLSIECAEFGSTLPARSQLIKFIYLDDAGMEAVKRL